MYGSKTRSIGPPGQTGITRQRGEPSTMRQAVCDGGKTENVYIENRTP